MGGSAGGGEEAGALLGGGLGGSKKGEDQPNLFYDSIRILITCEM